MLIQTACDERSKEYCVVVFVVFAVITTITHVNEPVLQCAKFFAFFNNTFIPEAGHLLIQAGWPSFLDEELYTQPSF